MFFLLVPILSFSQSPTHVPLIFPVSPEASKLGEFDDVPVNLSAGTTGLNIPIFNIEEGDFTLPIQLKYHYSGLVVDQIPGDLGLGWSLETGGMVKRQVMGRPDKDTNGYIGQNRIGFNWVLPCYKGDLSTSPVNNLKENAYNGSYDTRPINLW